MSLAENGITTVRIVRRRVQMKLEVYAEYIVHPKEWPKSDKAQHILKTLLAIRDEEPRAGWHLEFRGTERDWHVSTEPLPDILVRCPMCHGEDKYCTLCDGASRITLCQANEFRRQNPGAL